MGSQKEKRKGDSGDHAHGVPGIYVMFCYNVCFPVCFVLIYPSVRPFNTVFKIRIMGKFQGSTVFSPWRGYCGFFFLAKSSVRTTWRTRARSYLNAVSPAEKPFEVCCFATMMLFLTVDLPLS